MTGTGGDEPWAPFPVQDWEAYRRSPSWQEAERARVARQAGRDGSTPDGPGRGGPAGERGVVRAAGDGGDVGAGATGGRPWSRVAVVVTLVVCLLSVSAFALAAHTTPERASRWAPTDGHAATVRLTDGSTATVEDALMPAGAVESSLSVAVATDLNQVTGQSGLLWRQTVAADDPASPLQVAVYALGTAGAEADRIRLLYGYRAGGPATLFAPGVLLLGADGAGSWQSSGAVLAQGRRVDTYTAQTSARPAAGGCLDVTGRIDYAAGGTVAIDDRFCAGQGLTRRSAVAGIDGYTPSDRAAVLPARGAASAAATAAPGGAPTAVAFHPAGPRTDDADVPLGSLTSTTVPLTADVLAVEGSGGLDVTLFRGLASSAPTRGLQAYRLLHPGSTITAVAAVDGVLVTATADLRLVAWTPSGRRLWSVDTGGLVDRPPVDLGGGRIGLVTSTGGVLALDRATGRTAWSATVASSGDAVAAAGPVPAGTATAGPAVFAVVDDQGTVRALDPATGAVRWAVDGDPAIAVAVDADGVDVADGTFLSRYRAADGSRAWRTRLDDTASSLVLAGRTAIVLSSQGVSAIGPDGRRRWRVGGACTDRSASDNWVGCWTTSAVRVTDVGTGRVSTPASMPALRYGPNALVTAHGVWVFDLSAWQAFVWRTR